MIKLISNSNRNEYDIKPLVMSFFPGESLEYIVSDDISRGGGAIYMTLKELGILVEFGNVCEEITYDTEPDPGTYRDDLKRLMYRVLGKTTGRTNRWGTLTGVRPSKIPMKYLEDGLDEDEIIKIMIDEYYCSEDKARLSTRVAANELGILRTIRYEQGYSVYIGIPFCPTVCNYCSFSSVSLNNVKNADKLMRDYMSALEAECVSSGKLLAGKKLSGIYVGGGTPTALDEECLMWLMRIVRENFDAGSAAEFTVEAGRPDSITRDKLQILKDAGVTRISINPQTMKEDTLRLMGRNHTVKQVQDAFGLARNMGFDNINMDLIAGLMGEDVNDFRHTLDGIKELSPDSFTVHSLVVKRASEYRNQCEAENVHGGLVAHNSDIVEQMLDIAAEYAAENGYFPYYMYRQKNKAGLGCNTVLENVGYARKGKEGIYNVVIMEEKQPILAFGAGASSKFLFGGRIERVINVKNVNEYIMRIDEMAERKKRCLCNG